MAPSEASKECPDDLALYFDTVIEACLAETIQDDEEVPPYPIDMAKMAGMADAVAKFNPNKAELASLIIGFEAALQKLEDVMREAAEEITPVGVKTQHDPNYEEHEDAQADTTVAMDEEDYEDARK